MSGFIPVHAVNVMVHFEDSKMHRLNPPLNFDSSGQLANR